MRFVLLLQKPVYKMASSVIVDIGIFHLVLYSLPGVWGNNAIGQSFSDILLVWELSVLLAPFRSNFLSAFHIVSSFTVLYGKAGKWQHNYEKPAGVSIKPLYCTLC